MYCKRLTALLLTIAMLLSMLTMFVSAANSEDEALKEINIFNGGQSLSCLAVNGRVQTLNYVYYSHNGREIPTYCVNPSADGVPQKVGPGESIEYIIGERASDPKIMGIVANGFPTKSLGELGLVDKVEGYYATKIALWCYIIPGWSINAVTVNPNLSGEKLTQAQRVLAAAKKIHQYGTWWTEVPTAALTTSVDRELAYPVTIDGKSYKQQVFTVSSPTFVANQVVHVAFQDPEAIPAGTRIVNMENEDITQVAMDGSGMNISGQFKILYPADTVAGQEGSIQLELQAETYQYGVFYASCAQTDVYGNIQNYLCDTDPTKPITVSAISKYGTSEIPDDPETGLKIIKVQEGTQTPLEGAIFEVKGPNGDTIGQYSTDTSGTIMVPLTISGTYTVTEIIPPENHTLSKNPTQAVTVSYGKVATVTFENAPYGSLRVEKISDTGDRLEGVTIQIKHIETGTTYTQKTEAGGAAVFTELKPGAYEVREVSGIEGWLPDTETVVTVSVVTGETVTATLKNKELPGLRILKYDRQTMAVMPNVTFEVSKDNQSIGTYIISQYQMDFPHRPVRPRRVRTVARARLHQQAVWFLYVATITFSTAVGLLTELIRQIVRSHDLETEKKKAELALYKAQINPHFLFNTLNTLYGMIVMKSQQVETAFMQFICLMKYMYTNPTKEAIPVEEEIDYIRQYIEIQKYRTENKDSIQLSYYNDNKRQGLQIVPMLLITFVENAIKYGLSSTDDRQVYIVIRIEDGTLFFSTQNQKPTDRRGHSAGIGISNCRKRLELAYPKRHKLEINDADGLYTVLLSITLIN